MNPPPALLPTHSPPEVARRWRVKPERVITLIRSGKLQAFNIASEGCIRPRYRITPEALVAFERSLAVVPPKPVARRRKAGRKYFK